VVPEEVLKRLGVESIRTVRLRLADGRVVELRLTPDPDLLLYEARPKDLAQGPHPSKLRPP